MTTQLLPLIAMARRLGVSPAWLRAEADAGRLPGVRAGDGWLFHAPTIQRLLTDRARKAVRHDR